MKELQSIHVCLRLQLNTCENHAKSDRSEQTGVAFQGIFTVILTGFCHLVHVHVNDQINPKQNEGEVAQH